MWLLKIKHKKAARKGGFFQVTQLAD